MSNEPKVVSAVGSAVGSSRAAGVPGTTFGPTGRYIDGDDEWWSPVQTWAQLEEHGRIVSDALNQRLTVALASAQPFLEKEATCFRGVPFHEDFVPRSDNMGPPSDGNTVATGRYNHDAKRVLYLSDSEAGVAREVEHGANHIIWVQEFTLKLDDLRIADFHPSVESLLNHVFWWQFP